MGIHPNELVIAELTVSGLRHQVQSVFSTHVANIDAAAKRAVDEAVKNYDMEAELRRMAEVQLRSTLEHAVSSAVRVAMDHLRAEVEQAVLKTLTSMLQGGVKQEG